MKVVIKEREYDYISDYPNGWLFASGDPYKFPVDIGKYTCFVKRFEKKRPDDISGWDLLVQLKGKFDPNLPRIYDVVEVAENNKSIYYIFYEFLAGQTLEAAVNRNVALDLHRLTLDIFNAAEALHARQFWFSDFCEKNIFAEANGRFLLIDLDSVQPLAEVPHNNMYGDKQYWALVLKFYKEQLGYKNMRPADLSGAILNYLQILFLVLRLKLALQDKRYDYKSTELYDNLPQLLLDTDSTSFQDLFTQALAESKEGQALRTASATKELIIRQIIQNDQIPYQPTRRLPEIVAFKVSDAQVAPRQSFSLAWEVVNATQVTLYRNGVLYQEIRSGTNTLELRENYDGRPKTVAFTLRATSNAGEQMSAPVSVTIMEQAFMPNPKPSLNQEDAPDKQTWPIQEEETTPVPDTQPYEPEPFKPINPDQPAKEPTIQLFEANTTQVIGGQKINLKWEVAAATEVELYRNDQLYSNILESQGSLDIKEDYDASATSITYYLVAANKNGRTRSSVLPVSIIKPITPDPGKLRYIRLAMAVLFLAIAGILGVVASGILFRKKIKVLALRGDLVEGQTLGIRGENLPEEAGNVQVLFNALPGKIITLSPDSMRVVVPAVNTTQDSIPVRLALLVEQDTVYTANNLTFKKKLNSKTEQPSLAENTIGKPTTSNSADSQSTYLPTVTPKSDPSQDNNTLNNLGASKDQPKPNKTKPVLPKPYKPKPKPNDPKPAVKPESDGYSTHPTVDIYKLVTVKSNVIAKQRRNGTKNLEITVQNSSAYDLDLVRVEIEYLRKNDRLVAKESLDFTNVRAHTSQTLAAPDNEKGKKVNFKIVSIDSKQLY
ncbi:IPT/TIG domain-containing protein [Adhaeribacter pallidiroseus]|uniref:Uncharacterized protein n=1 Tax=Adhaeribacter pallidiroseus TaxID=2072847 RepID=A0A369QII7_9BACT|nr:IPT/TIG domain-containing protein [Adhaeribacter pallidiroseus]RDC62689.1 hypothetical protein AHMF7616_01283 [Adhaeribacter pallidiroseus]